MKKIIALVLALAMLLCFAGCGAEKGDKASASDLDYVKDKGTLVVGITDFEPMDYKNDKEEWIGFDADMAKAFAESLGVKVEFVEIDWDNKAMELDSKNIDCVWNGMTIDDEVKAAMDVSDAYCNNQQIVIVAAADKDKYQTVEACKELKFAVEAGSAGKKEAEKNGFQFTEVKDQATALQEVKAGTCNAAVIDSLMAAAMVGEGTGFADLTYTIGLSDEEYGVGFRKGSDLVASLNEFFKKSAEDGTTDKVAGQYGVQAALIK